MTQKIETLETREAAMREVLRYVLEKRPFENLNHEQQRILKECQDMKFFEGIVLAEMVSGRITGEYRFEPRLTYAGMQFIYAEPADKPAKVEISYSEEERELQSDQKQQEKTEDKAERKLDRRYQLLGALLVALVTLFLEHIGQIVRIIAQLFHQ